MEEDIERNLGEQPIAALIATHKLRPHDLVAAAPSPITHKMVARAVRGRRLTLRVQYKILNAMNAATGQVYTLPDLFTY